MAAAELRLEGAPNFRDLGGYKTADGRSVKRGLVFRSGDSGLLTTADIDKLKAINPRLVVDLRSLQEAATNEIRWPRENAEFIAANILADLRAGNASITELLGNDPTPRGAGHMMEMTYSVLPHALGPTLLRMAKYIVEEARVPVIFHCTVGRDRAGITAAMLLFALGVPRDTVIADYLRTNIHIDAGYIREMSRTYLLKHRTTLDEEALDILTYARIEHFHMAFRTVAVEYGSVTAYLDSIGIDSALREGLRERLLDSV